MGIFMTSKGAWPRRDVHSWKYQSTSLYLFQSNSMEIDIDA